MNEEIYEQEEEIIEKDNENNNFFQPEPEQYENDDQYMLELQRRVAMMKNERKQAEKDSQLLYNRLKLLNLEENKTLKKISNTKNKTNEKMNQLVQLHENLRIKQQLKEKKDREIEIQKQINLERKFYLKNKLEQKKDEKLRQLNEEFKLLKIQKEYNKELRNYIVAEEYNMNKTKCENIRNQICFIDEKKKANEIEKRNKNRIELEKKLLEEYKLKEEADQKMQQLETQEMEILKRIRTTTQVHKNMCEQLEKLNVQDFVMNNFENDPIEKMNLNKSQSLQSLKKNNSFIKK